MQVDADLWGTAKFVDSVRLPYIAPSLGGIESLIEQPTVISYWDQVGCLSCRAQRAPQGRLQFVERSRHVLCSCSDLRTPSTALLHIFAVGHIMLAWLIIQAGRCSVWTFV